MKDRTEHRTYLWPVLALFDAHSITLAALRCLPQHEFADLSKFRKDRLAHGPGSIGATNMGVLLFRCQLERHFDRETPTE